MRQKSLVRGGYAGTNYSFLTSKERDTETGLDYFGARYYSPIQGRFTSNDPLNPVLNRQLSAGNQTAQQEFVSWILEPQHWNKYTYSLNNPLRYVDPNGEDRTLDTRALNNTKIFFRGGKRVER